MPDTPPSRKPRIHCVSVRLSADELAELDRQRGRLQRGAWLRRAWQGKLPVPEFNRAVWVELARAAANLNQLARHFNKSALKGASILANDIELVRRELEDFRKCLIKEGGIEKS